MAQWWIKFEVKKIPSHVSVFLQEIVTLRDRYRNKWLIKTRKIDGVWYLLDGWAKFISDCSVNTMDVLVFTYSGPGSFDVNIMGTDGVMREGVGYRKTNVEIENDNVDTFERVYFGNNEGCSRNAHKKKRTVTKGSQSVKRMKHLNINEPDNKGKDYIIISSDEDSEYRPCEDDFRSGNVQTKIPKLKTRDVKAPASINRVDYLGKKLLRAAGIRRPKLKYFVTKIKRNRMNDLHIPRDLVLDKNLKIPGKIQLVDIDGNTYSSFRTSWRDGRRFFKGGWNRLCRKITLLNMIFASASSERGMKLASYSSLLYVKSLSRPDWTLSQFGT